MFLAGYRDFKISMGYDLYGVQKRSSVISDLQNWLGKLYDK